MGSITTAGSKQGGEDLWIINEMFGSSDMPFIPTLPEGTIIQPPCFLIEKEGKKSYLFGTCHFLRLDIVPKSYLEKIKFAKNIVLESLSEKCKSKEEAEELLIKDGFISKTCTSWYEKLSPTALEIVENARKRLFENRKYKMDILLGRFEPSAVSAVCHVATIRGGMDEELEDLFENKSFPLEKLDKEGMNFLFHEKWELTLEQDLIDNFSHLKNIPDYSSFQVQLAIKYLVGQFICNVEEACNSEQGIEMVERRNIDWLPKIMSYHSTLEGPVVFAVGAGHLLGRKGLLYLLQNVGFKIYIHNSLTDKFFLINACYLYDQMGESIDLQLGIVKLLTNESIPPIAQREIIEYMDPEMPIVWSKVFSESPMLDMGVPEKSEEVLPEKKSRESRRCKCFC